MPSSRRKLSVVTVEPVAALSLNVIFFLVDTLRDWIYSLPTWLSGSFIVFGAVALALLGLISFHQFVPLELRRAHNDVAGFILAIVGRGERTSKDGNRCLSLTQKSQNFAQRQALQRSIQRSYTPLTISTGPDVTG
jgi:hypothetical protein